VPLLSTGTNVVGETISYPQGTAHVTATTVTLAPGGHTIVHRHGVPLFAYILFGELTVDYGMRGMRTYRQGAFNRMGLVTVTGAVVDRGDRTAPA